MIFSQLLQSYLDANRPGPSVRRVLVQSWPRFESFCELHRLQDAKNVTPAHVQDFHQHLLWEPNEKGHFYKANSVDQILRRVRQVLRWGFTAGYLATDPTRELVLPRPVQPIAEKLSWKELRLLFKAPDRSTAIGLRDAVLFRLVAETELGVSGCLELRLGHELVLQLEQETGALLAAYLQRGRPVLATRPEEVALFLGRGGRPLGAQAIFVRIQDAAKQAGLRQLVGGRTIRKSYLAHLDRQARARLVIGP